MHIIKQDSNYQDEPRPRSASILRQSNVYYKPINSLRVEDEKEDTNRTETTHASSTAQSSSRNVYSIVESVFPEHGLSHNHGSSYVKRCTNN